MGRRKPEGLVQFKKGDTLFKSGTPANRLYIIQQGLVSILLADAEESIELFKAAQPQLIGEEVLAGKPEFETTAIAVNDTSAIEVKSVELQALLKSSLPLTKFLINGLLAKESLLAGELRTIRSEAESLPCPLGTLSKTFAVIFHVAQYTGTTKNSAITVNWNNFRKYCQRVFLESPVKLENMMHILKKVRFVDMQYVKSEIDPDAPDELGFIHFKEIQQIGSFAEFMRANYNPKEPSALFSNPDFQGTVYMDILGEISYWNRHGLPQSLVPPNQTKKAG